MSIQELLQDGIEASQVGDIQRAAMLFARVVCANPSSELGWLWLGRCCVPLHEKEFCFKSVLSINPNNLDAKNELEKLSNLIDIQVPFETPGPIPGRKERMGRGQSRKL
jgi:hypothetical protein